MTSAAIEKEPEKELENELDSRVDIFQQRRCGALLPITSLPAVGLNKQAGFDSAQRFIDWIASAGISVWQLLPMGPPHADLSPYLDDRASGANKKPLQEYASEGGRLLDDTD